MLDIQNVMETLIQISEEKYSALEQIYKLTKEQTSAIEDEDIDKLNILIEQKQEEIDIMKSLDMKFEAIVEKVKLEYNIQKLDELNVCHDDVKRIQYIISMIMSRGKQIHDIEVKNSDELRNAKSYLENKIKNLKVGKKAVSGYGYNVKNPVYFDKKSGR